MIFFSGWFHCSWYSFHAREVLLYFGVVVFLPFLRTFPGGLMHICVASFRLWCFFDLSIGLVWSVLGWRNIFCLTCCAACTVTVGCS